MEVSLLAQDKVQAGDLLFSWLFWVSQGHAHNLSLCPALVPAA